MYTRKLKNMPYASAKIYEYRKNEGDSSTKEESNYILFSTGLSLKTSSDMY